MIRYWFVFAYYSLGDNTIGKCNLGVKTHNGEIFSQEQITGEVVSGFGAIAGTVVINNFIEFKNKEEFDLFFGL